MCDNHQTAGGGGIHPRDDHQSCSCRTVLGIKSLLLLVILTVIVNLPCARGENAELRLNYSAFRGATDSMLNVPQGASILDSREDSPASLLLEADEQDVVPSVSNLNDVLLEDEDYVNEGARRENNDATLMMTVPTKGKRHFPSAHPNHHNILVALGGNSHEDSAESVLLPGDELPYGGVPLHDAEGDDGHDHDHDHDHSNLLWHVVGGAITITVVGYFGTVLPLWVTALKPGLINACNAFGAGGFWGLVFTHLFLEAIALCEASDVGIHFTGSGTFFNGAYGFSLIGYLFLLWVEVLLTSIAKTRSRNSRVDSDFEGPQQELVEHHGCAGIESPASPYSAADDVQLVIESSNHKCPARPHTHAPTATVISITTALTIHAFLEGLIVGLRDEASLIWLTVLSVCLHKWAVSLSLSARLIGAVSTGWFWSVGSLFNFASGVAVIVGYFIGTADGPAGAIANALGVGVVVYVSQDITHSLFHGEDHHVDIDDGPKKHVEMGTRSNLILLTCLTLGATLIFGASCLHFAQPGGHVH